MRIYSIFQNIISNDVEKISSSNTLFSALLTPQGKYLFEFFILKSKEGYLLDCDNKFTDDIVNYLSKYKLRSKIEIELLLNLLLLIDNAPILL